MSAELNLKQIEIRAFTSYFKDGIFELFFAIMIFASLISDVLPILGASVRVEQFTGIGIIFCAVIFFTLGKLLITKPRLGQVRFSKERRTKIHRLQLILLPVIILAVISVASFLSGNNETIAQTAPVRNYYTLAFITLLVFFVISAVAYTLNYPRLYIVAFIMALTKPAYSFIKQDTDWRPISVYVYTVPFLIILVIGIINLLKFLRKYPKSNREVDHVD